MADESDLIAAIYDAIIDPSRWDEVVKRIVEATKSVSGGLSHSAGRCGAAVGNVQFRSLLCRSYVQTYAQNNPLAAVER